MYKMSGIKCATIWGGGGDFLQDFYSKLNILTVQYIQKMDPVEHKLFFWEMDGIKCAVLE